MNGTTPKVLELAQELKDITQREGVMLFLRITGTPPEVCGLPSLDVLEGLMNRDKDLYMQQMRTLSPEELRALRTLV